MLLEFFLVFNLFIPANIEKNQKKNYLSFMFHNHFAVHGKWTTWQDISNCRIRKDWKRSCSSHAILWCDGRRTWRFEVRVLYRVLLWEAVWPNGSTSSWYRVIILNSIFLFLFLSFFLFFGFYFSNFQSNQNEPSDNISNCPSRQVMRMNDLISLQVVFLS